MTKTQPLIQEISLQYTTAVVEGLTTMEVGKRNSNESSIWSPFLEVSECENVHQIDIIWSWPRSDPIYIYQLNMLQSKVSRSPNYGLIKTMIGGENVVPAMRVWNTSTSIIYSVIHGTIFSCRSSSSDRTLFCLLSCQRIYYIDWGNKLIEELCVLKQGWLCLNNWVIVLLP